jgi:coenzyme F420-reducing hydrogenase delta subunit/Pyruvate/2-oxoacid:ferredoxin oxidoreductase delta subunit
VPSASVLVRAPAAMALSLDMDQATPGRLLERAQHRTLLDIDPNEGIDIEVLPMRSRIRTEACRGCSACIDVCPFNAIKRVSNGIGPHAHIEPSLCRGCNLCIGVCPTYAATSSSLSPEWWGEKIEDALVHPAAAKAAQRYVVLACQRRAGALEESVDKENVHAEVIRFRCVGQIQAGMMLELVRNGARGILVAGCHPDRCRFGTGAKVANEQVEQARNTLRHLGLDPGLILTDASPSRAFDRLEDPIARLVRGSPVRDLSKVKVTGEEDADNEF